MTNQVIQKRVEQLRRSIEIHENCCEDTLDWVDQLRSMTMELDYYESLKEEGPDHV